MTDKRLIQCVDCDKFCADHTINTSKIAVLESEYKIVENNSKTVSSLSGKFSLLLIIMGIVTAIVAGGAIYTFTGVSDFKVAYLGDRLALHQQIAENHDKNREIFQTAITTMSSELRKDIKVMGEEMDRRMDVIESDIVVLKNTKVDRPNFASGKK